MLVWVLASPALADWPLGAEIPSAVIADVTPAGLDALVGVIPGLIPSSVAIPPIADSDEGGCVFGFCAYAYEYSVTNGSASLLVQSLELVPGTGTLTLDGSLLLTINSRQNPIDIYLYGEAIGIGISDSCDAWVDPVAVDISVAVQLTLLADGTVDAYVPPVGWGWTLSEDDIQLDGCTADDIESVLSFFGIELFDYLIDAIEPQVDAIVADLAPTLEGLIEDAFAPVSVIEGSVDLVGVPLDYTIRPSEITIDPAGVRIGLSGAFSTEPDPCVAQYGITESRATVDLVPAIGEFPTVLGYDPHLGLAVDDDFLNQALFAVWESGLLCQELDSASAESLGLPLAIDSSLLNLIAPDAYDDLVPDTVPLTITVSPTLPPTASAQGLHDVNIDLDGLELDFFAEVDGRPARLVGVDMQVDAGVDLAFDGTLGTLGVAIALAEEDITSVIGYNELNPESNAEIEAGFQNLFGSLVVPVLQGFVSDLSFPVPSFTGFGVTGLDVLPTGDLGVDPTGGAGEHLGVFATVGTVAYPETGCDASSGCGDTGGCDSGTGTGTTSGTGTCSTTPAIPARLLTLLVGAVFALRRRRI